MINKKSLTENILQNMGDKKEYKKEYKTCKGIDVQNNVIKKNCKSKSDDNKNNRDDLRDINQIKLDLNSFIMVPINHPNIDEIIKLLNNFKNKSCINENISSNNLSKDSEIKKTIITLNDILNSNQNKFTIPTNSIITPMARDYIKQKEIKITYEEEK